MRPLLPFDDTWIHGDLLMVVDPWFWVCLTPAAMLGGPPGLRRSSGWVIFAGLGTWLVASRTTDPVPTALFGTAMGILIGMRLAGWGQDRRSTFARLGVATALIYLLAFSVVRNASREQALAMLSEHAGHALETSDVTTQARPGVPWSFIFITHTDGEVHRLLFSLLSDTQSIESKPRHLDHPGLREVTDTPEYRAWLSFARHPFVALGTDSLVLCDARYGWNGQPSWCNLVVSLP